MAGDSFQLYCARRGGRGGVLTALIPVKTRDWTEESQGVVFLVSEGLDGLKVSKCEVFLYRLYVLLW